MWTAERSCSKTVQAVVGESVPEVEVVSFELQNEDQRGRRMWEIEVGEQKAELEADEAVAERLAYS